MRVHHEARGGRVTERFAVELEGRHMEAISDLYLSLFNTDEARQSALGEAFWAIHKEWKLDNDPQGVLIGSAALPEKMACPTEKSPRDESRTSSGGVSQGVSLD